MTEGTGGMRPGLAALAGLLVLVVLMPGARAQAGPVLVAEVTGEITSATVQYVQAAIRSATSAGASALVIRFDTPGGGLDETLAIQQMFDSTAVPILGWVGPTGVSAWSAGTILLESTDLAAMAPHTTIGSVQPVTLTAGGVVPVTDAKVINAVEGNLREHLIMHGRNESLAAAFVERNLNLNATEAVAANATELVAGSVQALIAGAQGRQILKGGVAVTLDFQGAEVIDFSEPIGVALYAIIANPIVSGLLLLLGIYAIIFGITAPGHGAEIAGIIMIALGVLGLGLSVNLVGIFLLILGIILLIIEAKVPGFGVWGVAGIICVVLGTVFLAPIAPPRFLLSSDAQLTILAALVTPTAAFGVFLLFGMYKVMQVRRRKPLMGELVGEVAEAVDRIRPGARGYVLYLGELWLATSAEEIQPGEKVSITAKDGPLLTVKRVPAPTAGPNASPQAT